MQDTRDFFNKEELSDITIKLSNGKEIKCHKLILCAKSECFKKMLALGIGFKLRCTGRSFIPDGADRVRS